MSNIGNLIWNNMVEIANEEIEACIHCGTQWYRIHHRDGVCHRCQAKGLPSRTQLAARKRTRQCLRALIWPIAVILIMVAIYLLNK